MKDGEMAMIMILNTAEIFFEVKSVFKTWTNSIGK